MTQSDTASPDHVSAYLSYLDVLVDLERLWAADEFAFGAARCREIANDLARRAVELNAKARDWMRRADETERTEKPGQT